MKITLTLLASSLLFVMGLSAQIQIQLGSGTNVTGANTASPINIWYSSARSQMVYTAAELNAAGAFSGNILKLGFYVEQAPIYNLPGFSIKMKHTSATDASVHDAGPFEEVYLNANYAPIAGGFDLLTLDVPFQWNGTGNILIDVCFDIVQPIYNSSGRVRYYDVANGYRYDRNDNLNMCPNATTVTHSQKPQLLLEFSALAPNDAGVLSVDAPFDFCPGMHDVVATIANFGTDTINNVTVNWEFNGVLQTPLIYTTPIDTLGSGNNTAQVILGNKNFTAGQVYPIRAWTSGPNSLADTINFNDTTQVVVAPGLVGAYTIGGTSPDYGTFAEALAALEFSGVCGPVIFNVRNGTYNEQLNFPEISGMDTTNTVTFQSESGDSSLVTLTYSSLSTDNYTVQLDGADWFVFKNLTIEATNISYGHAIVLQNEASHNRFEHCALRGYSTNNTNPSLAVVYSPDNNFLDENNVFQNCLIQQGSYGFYFSGDGISNRESGNIVENCRVENSYYRAIYAQYQDTIKIKNNDIQANTVNTGSGGIEVYYVGGRTEILKNRIAGFMWGIRITYSDGAPSENILVANNFVHTQGSGAQHSIYSLNGSYQSFLHNTVRQFNTNSSAAAFYNTGGSNKVLLNNIFANEGGGYAIYRNLVSGISQSDYNNFYATGQYIGYLNTNFETLADWQNATSQDSGSFDLNPFFLSDDSYTIAQVSLNGAATTLGGIDEDIEGEARDAQNPDIGCDEFVPPTTDAGITAILPPAIPFTHGPQPVSANLKNYGTDGLASVTLKWAVNGVLQTPVNWTGTIASSATEAVPLGIFDFAIKQEYGITAWTSQPNGLADGVAVNDTATVGGIYAGLSGAYTVGGASPDFNNFAEAATSLSQGGVTGHVSFNVRDGAYNEQLVLGEILGADTSNTVTFQSESGDSSLVTLTYNSNSAANYTVLLDGADWIRFENMTLEATNSNYGIVLDMRNGAAENRFEYCEFRGLNTTNTGINMAVVYSPANIGGNNAFVNNAVLNGSYGFYMHGLNLANLETGLVIENNRIDNAYYTGIFLQLMEQLLIHANRIRTISPFHAGLGIYLDTDFDGVEISSNQIIGFQNAGIYLFNGNANIADPMLITNNFIQTYGASSGFGIFTANANSSHQKFFHNSINVLNTDAVSSAFYTSQGSNDVHNNIFANSGGGYAFFRGSANGVNTSDYNDLYSSGANIGYWDGDRASLVDWQTASGQDLHSVSDNPYFVEADSFAVTQISLNGAGTSLPEVPNDIEGEARDALFPDIGCDEFSPPPDDAGITQVLAPAVPFASGQQLVRVALKNFGTDTLLSATLNWTLNGSLQAPVAWTGSLLSGDTLLTDLAPVNFTINQAHDITAWTSQPNGQPDGVTVNDTAAVGGIYAGLSGPYTIGGASPDFNTFAEAAINLNQGGVTGAVAFNVRDGAYNEQLVLGEILGADMSNTVTFQSESGDSSLVILTSNSNSVANYTVLLDGADWVRFENMTLEATNSSYGIVLDMRNGAAENRFEHCEFRGVNIASTSVNIAVISAPGNTGSNNAFVNNAVLNGSLGFNVSGFNVSNLETGLVIESNRIENAYYRGLFLRNTEQLLLNANRVSPANASASGPGIYLYECFDVVEASSNQVTGFTDYGIYLYNCTADAAAPALIANNFVQTSGSGLGYGLSMEGGSFQKIYHNTVRVLNANANGYAFYTSLGSNKDVRNNIFANEGGGYAYYRGSTNDVTVSDYNGLYASGANIGYLNGVQAALADWQVASGLDLHSVSGNPYFVASDSFAITQISLDRAGTPLPEVPADIEGETRDASFPDIGCDEFLPPPNNAGLTLILPPAMPFASGQQLVRVVLKNFGADTLQSAVLNWTLNGSLQPPVAWTGNLPSGDTLLADLVQVDFSINQAYDITAWTSQPNGTADAVVVNDSSSVENLYAALAGAYTIGGAVPDFNTFGEAVTNLDFGGVLGAVTFNVRNGIYAEQILLKEIVGVDSANTVLFQSESGDSTEVLLTFSSPSATNYTVLFEGADHIHFHAMTIEASSSLYHRVVELLEGSNHVSITNCILRSGGLNYTNVYITGVCEYMNLSHNVFEQGYYGIGYDGNSNGGNYISGTIIEYNEFKNQMAGGLNIDNQSFPQVNYNKIYGGLRGLVLEYCYNSARVLGNQIYDVSNELGIYLYYVYGTAADPVLVANNFVQVGGTGLDYGIYTYDGNYQNFYHNSVNLTNTNSGSPAFYSSFGSNKRLLNNIFANPGGGYAILVNSTGSIAWSDHNDLYSSGPTLGYWNGAQADLAAWSAASSMDTSSVSLLPGFVSDTNLHINNVALNAIGTPLAEVADDIDGEPRNPASPDCGADEFITAQNDVAVLSVDSPSMLFAADIQPVCISIFNNGLDTLTSMTVNWEVNGIQQPPYNWADTLLSADSRDSICIGAFLFEIDTAYTIIAWASNPNGLVDEEPVNDTARAENLYAALGGFYTIGGIDPDFSDFASAIQAMINGGVAGEVTFNVRDGIYTEQISIPEIVGADAANTITFQSESGDSTAVRLTYNSATSIDNYTLQLDGADWIRFEKMTLENASPTYSRVVDIRNGASNNRFANNEVIGADIDSPSFNNYTLVYSGGSKDDGNVFTGNRFLEGSYGFYYLGGGTFTLEEGTRIEGNTFAGQYYTGIHLYYQDAPVIKENDITAISGPSPYYGINCSYCDNNMRIVGNVAILASGVGGISIEYCDGTAAGQGLVANNFIGILGANTTQGIYLYYATNQNIYHNNVNINSTPTDSRAVLLTGGASIRLINNVLANSSGGYVIYNQSTSNISGSDYNDLYTTGANIAYRNGSNVANLSDWQTLTNLDANSFSVDPLFESPTDLHVREVDLNNAATPVPEVADDIDGEARDPVMPDIGADEFAPVSSNDAGIVEITHPNKITPFAAGLQPVDMVIRNSGSDTLTTATINWFVNGNAQTAYTWTGFLEPGERDTVSAGNFDFELKFSYDILAYSSLPNGMVDSLAINDSSFVDGLYAGLDGVYTVGGLFPDFISFSEAANTLNQGGMLGSVTFNARNGVYNEQMSLGEIRGSGPASTITFQSESGDSSLVTLVNNNSLPDYTVQLNGTDNVTFQNLTLQAGLLNYSTVIELGNGVTNLQLLNNRIAAPAFANDDLVESVGSSLDNNLVFRNNFFEGGRYAINLAGQNTGQRELGTLIEGNTFVSQATGAVSMIYMEAPAIRSNIISGEGSGTAYYGLFLRYCDNGMEVSRNKITHAGNYGMYFSYCDASSSNRSLVANNFIHLEGSSANYGIYTYNCNFQNIYFNNIHITGTNTGSRAFNTIYGGNNNLLNNVLANSSGGYAIYASSSSSLSNSNYNDLYTTGSWVGNWLGSNASNLTSWKSLSGRDNNSVSENPLFYSAADLHVLQVALDSAATTIPGITEDIDGDTRQPNHPDIGADEFDYLEDDLGIVALLSPANGCGLSNAEAVKVVIQNFGGLPQSGFDVAYSFNGGAVVVENIGTLAVQPGDTAHYAFSTMVNVSTHTIHSFDAETQLANDLNPGNDMFSASVENFLTPPSVGNMLPADGSTGLPRSILFSWSPSAGAIRYDLYIWPDGGTPPASPTLSDITQIIYLFNGNSFFAYGQAYNWQVVAKNNHCETAGPIQGFTIQELPDLVVDSVLVPASAFSGQVMDLTWVVKNMGSGSTGMGQWRDYIYLSDDLIFDLGTDTYLGNASNFSALAAGESYSNTQSFMLPQGLSGSYYIFIWTDRYNYLAEADNNNNTGISSAFVINLTPPPDLQVTSIIPPNNAFSGMPVSVNWTVTNEGTGETRSGSWWDRVYLSPDTTFIQNNATYLGQKRFYGMLDVDSSYTQSLSGTLPQGISGDYYIYVLTDYYNYEYEHANELNNTTRSSVINVVLTPPPDLVATDVVIPDSASNRETVAVQWTVENQGGSTTNNYWVDYIYLSDNPNAANLSNAIFLGSRARPNNLGPLESYTTSRNVSIPDNITGPYYFYIHTDRNDNVFEYIYNDNNITRSDGTTLVQTPDLTVANVAAPVSAMSGNAITVNWTVKNTRAGKLQNRSLQDRVYISTSATYSPGLATQVGSLNATVTLLPGDSLNRQLQVVLPNGISGQYYVFVGVDGGNSIYENGLEANNISSPGEPLAISLSPYVDLTPTAINGPTAGNAGQAVNASFTVKNMGTADAQGLSWKDKIYILNTSVWNSGSAQLLRTEQVSQTLAVDSSYTINTTVNLPVNLSTGTYFFFIVTDQENNIYEYTQENNNRLVSNGILVTGYPPVDLAVTAATSADSINSGQAIQVSWTVENQSAFSTIASYWFDAIYLSADTILDENVDQLLATRQQNGPLPGGASYSASRNVTTPNGLSGPIYFIVKTDDTELNNDENLNNNYKVVADTAGNNQVVTVELTPPPDLIVPSFITPAQGTSGQPIQVVWTVQNNGTGGTLSGSWADRIYLSTDLTLDGGDQAIATISHSGNLAVGASYTDTVLATIPVSVSGNRIIIIKTDYNNVVFEHTSEGNNTASAAIFITQPPPADLIVSNVIVPASAIAGEEVMVEWTLQNIGANPAVGSMKEAVYFSADDVWDVGDPLLDVLSGSVNLGPSAVANRSLMADLTGVAVGGYYAIVRTDILNNIYESNDNNNTTVSDMQVSVDVNELPLNVLTPNTLADNMELYYRIEIPDSLSDESLLVTLKGDSVAGTNELYLRFGSVPSRVVYDQAYGIPFFGNQEVIIPEIQPGTYYLMAYGNTSNDNEQNITLLAEILDFEIRDINADKGGNTGRVTVEINGGKFDSTMIVRLENGMDVITAGNVLIINRIKAYATFDLNGKPLGIYDVVATKSNGEMTVLPDGFEVVVGSQVGLATNIVHPANTRPGRVSTLKIEFANNGNVNIPDPIVKLISLDGAPIAFSVLRLDEGNTELLIPLIEDGAPSGLLRPGASGSITIYARADTAMGFILIHSDAN